MTGKDRPSCLDRSTRGFHVRKECGTSVQDILSNHAKFTASILFDDANTTQQTTELTTSSGQDTVASSLLEHYNKQEVGYCQQQHDNSFTREQL